jgi:hypothetical protein
MILDPLFTWLHKIWWNFRHPKRTLFVPERRTRIAGYYAPPRGKEDPKTKKRRKMAEASRKINRRK